MTNLLTRRKFLNMAGAIGGAAAVYQMALALGLMPGRAHGAPEIVTPLGKTKRSVVLLGGGLSSLMSAYELERAGYECTILEASHRMGGRNLTLRSGDLIDELGNRQYCRFDDEPHLYFNAGPARIPAHHHYVMHYCRELGVTLEGFTNVNYNAWVHDTRAFGGKPVRLRRYIADARGFIAELSAKAIDAGAFDAPLSSEDLERLSAFLKSYGDLDANALYKGSSRAGYELPGILAPTPGMLEHSNLNQPLELSEILKSDFWNWKMHFGEANDQSARMLQAVGGMDNIVKAFARNIRSPMLVRAQVKSIRIGNDGVAVVYQHRGEHKAIEADYCMNCIPMHLLVGIDNNFPGTYRKALGATGRLQFFKLGIQMSERFWERENIYGGISWTNQDITQIGYPSHGIHGKKGIVLAAYPFDPKSCDFFTRMIPDERFEEALRQGGKIHPSYRQYAENFVSIPWTRMNHHMGCAAEWTEETRNRYFSYLQTPLAGRHFMIGDQMSHHPGWQEGAFSSAHHALHQLQRQVTMDSDTAT
uniref:Tryptophan 2-monooxygenase n=1 Tax=Candidatus Kentrum sp. UNK TaxID=2126344 RepID=A0A451B1L6_9GAMM|nr:MAG: monoamine oxidase [Candidatus Kentron sp. UNK]VFK72164.1 MAG: monoamine oxidase [Candidatus Kentron sp. UNK]